jgi:hypothetical protein
MRSVPLLLFLLCGIKNDVGHDTLLQLKQLYPITSGDPSRGTIALDAYAAPTNGTPVKVCEFAKVFFFSAFIK